MAGNEAKGLPHRLQPSYKQYSPRKLKKNTISKVLPLVRHARTGLFFPIQKSRPRPSLDLAFDAQRFTRKERLC